MYSFLLSLLFAAAFPLALASVDPALIRSQITALDRLKLLSDEDYVFDFINSKVGESGGQGGKTVSANANTFPALMGNPWGSRLAFWNLAASTYGTSLLDCSNPLTPEQTPHVHPRATEFNLNVNSSSFATGVFFENGTRLVTQNLKPGQATICPQGAIHFEMNLGCEPMLFVAAFGSEDFGVLHIAQGFLSELPQDAVVAALGNDIDYTFLPELVPKIAANVAQGTKECLKRCGIKPASVSTPYAAPTSAGVPSNFKPSQAAQMQKAAVDTGSSRAPLRAAALAGDDSKVVQKSNNSAVLPLTIALAVINGLLAAALIGMVAMFLRRKPKQKFAQVNTVEFSDKFRDPYDTPSATPSSRP